MTWILNNLRNQVIAIFSLVVSASGFFIAYQSYRNQSTFMISQGKNLRIEFKRYSLFNHDPVSLVTQNTLESEWYVTIHNTSIQTALNIVGYEVYKTSGKNNFKISSEQNHVRSYSPFSSIDDGKAILLPISVPPGSSISLRMKIVVSIDEEAGKFLSSVRDGLDLDRAASLYSWKKYEQGSMRDIFGNQGFDNGGFSLNVPISEKEKVENPEFQLVLRTNRGNKYAVSATWYQMILLVPEDPKSSPLMVLPGTSKLVPLTTPSSAK